MHSEIGILGVGLLLLSLHAMAAAETAKSSEATIEMAIDKIVMERYD